MIGMFIYSCLFILRAVDEQEKEEEERETHAYEIVLPMLKDLIFFLQPPDKDTLSELADMWIGVYTIISSDIL